VLSIGTDISDLE